jgi:hypothetical protein
MRAYAPHSLSSDRIAEGTLWSVTAIVFALVLATTLAGLLAGMMAGLSFDGLDGKESLAFIAA